MLTSVVINGNCQTYAAAVKLKGIWHYYNLFTKQFLILSENYEVLHYYKEGIARVKVGEHFAYIDTSGSPVTKNLYSDAREFKNGIAAVLIGNKWGYINSSGEIIIKPQFDAAKDFYSIQ